MGIIAWLILGALAGWLASIIMGSNENMGALANIIVGILGAAIGGFIGTQLGWGDINSFNIYSILMSVLGACILIFILRLIRGKKA